MPFTMHIQVNKVNPMEPFSLLLQLLDVTEGLELVLQKLDRCNHASLAATCPALRAAMWPHISQITLQHSAAETHESVACDLAKFVAWLEQCHTSLTSLSQFTVGVPGGKTFKEFSRLITLLEQHGTSLASLNQLSIVSHPRSDKDKACLNGLPCPQLRQLHLSGLKVQLGPAGRKPCVLSHCTGFGALDLQDCSIVRMPTGSLQAALSQLQKLSLADNRDTNKQKVVWQLFPQSQLPMQLTHLGLDCHGFSGADTARLGQLSALVNLEHLELTSLGCDGVPGGVPSESSKLTRLGASFFGSTLECSFSTSAASQPWSSCQFGAHSGLKPTCLPSVT
jgi:hypothetical protein